MSVVVAPVMFNSAAMWYNHLHDICDISTTVLLKLADLGIKRVENEPQRLHSEAERLRCETALVVAQQQYAESVALRKRSAPTPTDDEWLESNSNAKWKGMASLSICMWEMRPLDCSLRIDDVYRILYQHIRQIQSTTRVPSRYRLRTLRRQEKTFLVVYADPKIDFASHVHQLWESGVMIPSTIE